MLLLGSFEIERNLQYRVPEKSSKNINAKILYKYINQLYLGPIDFTPSYPYRSLYMVTNYIFQLIHP